jgi:hypothetical protein
VVGVTAPAGYGKSTLLVEWAAGEDRPVAWVALDRLDDDPAVVLPGSRRPPEGAPAVPGGRRRR